MLRPLAASDPTPVDPDSQDLTVLLTQTSKKTEEDQLASQEGTSSAERVYASLKEYVPGEFPAGTGRSVRAYVEDATARWAMIIAGFAQKECKFPDELEERFAAWLSTTSARRVFGVLDPFVVPAELVRLVCRRDSTAAALAALQPLSHLKKPNPPTFVPRSPRDSIVWGVIEGTRWLRLREEVATRPASNEGALVWRGWLKKAGELWRDIYEDVKTCSVEIPPEFQDEIRRLFKILDERSMLQGFKERDLWPVPDFFTQTSDRLVTKHPGTFDASVRDIAGGKGAFADAFRKLLRHGPSPEVLPGNVERFAEWMAPVGDALAEVLSVARENPSAFTDDMRAVYTLYADLELQWVESFPGLVLPVLERNPVQLGPLLLRKAVRPFEPWKTDVNKDADGRYHIPPRLFPARHRLLLERGVEAVKNGEVEGRPVNRAVNAIRARYRLLMPALGAPWGAEEEFVAAWVSAAEKAGRPLPIGPLYLPAYLRPLVPREKWGTPLDTLVRETPLLDDVEKVEDGPVSPAESAAEVTASLVQEPSAAKPTSPRPAGSTTTPFAAASSATRLLLVDLAEYESETEEEGEEPIADGPFAGPPIIQGLDVTPKEFNLIPSSTSTEVPLPSAEPETPAAPHVPPVLVVPPTPAPAPQRTVAERTPLIERVHSMNPSIKALTPEPDTPDDESPEGTPVKSPAPKRRARPLAPTAASPYDEQGVLPARSARNAARGKDKGKGAAFHPPKSPIVLSSDDDSHNPVAKRPPQPAPLVRRLEIDDATENEEQPDEAEAPDTNSEPEEVFAGPATRKGKAARSGVRPNPDPGWESAGWTADSSAAKRAKRARKSASALSPDDVEASRSAAARLLRLTKASSSLMKDLDSPNSVARVRARNALLAEASNVEQAVQTIADKLQEDLDS